MNLTLDELLTATQGRSLSKIKTEFTGVGTDSRTDLTGQLFIALKGDSFDAHDFLEKAVAAGASALLVHRLPDTAKGLLDKVTVIEVKDTLVGLQALGNFWRRKLGRETGVKILGITGTNGKTTTKEFTAAILGSKLKVQYSKGSFNNHWGVPISLLSIDHTHQVAVIEMGMNHPGELKTLSKIAEPDAVVCTMVGRGHLEGVGSIEGAAQAKSEIYQHAPANAVKIFNLENPHTRAMFQKWGRDLPADQLITFAGLEYARWQGEPVSDDQPPALSGGELWPNFDVAFEVVNVGTDQLRIRGEIRGVGGETSVPVFGRQNITNLMTAACFGLVCGLTPEEIWKALPLCRSAWGRNQWVDVESGAKVLFDAYNANPESMRAAVENFAALKPAGGGRKIAVLAEMRELGQHTGGLHEELGRLVAQAGFEAVCFFGPSSKRFEAGMKTGGFQKRLFVSDSYENSLAGQMLPVLDKNDIVLFKGSRGMALEKVLAELKPVGFKAKS